ncbi:MAG: YjbH domain-containing protein [Pseudomonadales bacterium]|nr:YjbH domain-containing protein [Pseudomonadales bacterium]
MRVSRFFVVILWFCVLSVQITQAEENTLSFQGFSGLLNTPHGGVMEYGSATFMFSDQLEKRGRAEYAYADNYILGIGFFPHFELTGRIAATNTHDNSFLPENAGETRDLSANIKVHAPFIPEDWFDLAAGIQDLGGASNYFDAKFVVASKTISDFRFSAGIGKSESHVGRMDGVFGGIEWMPLDWLRLMAEYDGADSNVGGQLQLPVTLGNYPIDIGLKVQLLTDAPKIRDKNFFGISLSIPLTKQRISREDPFENIRDSAMAHLGLENTQSERHDQNSGQDNAEIDQPEQKASEPSAIVQTEQSIAPGAFGRSDSQDKMKMNDLFDPTNIAQSVPPMEDGSAAVLRLRTKQLGLALIEYGFEGVEVGYNANSLYVVLENNVLNNNEIDVFGVVFAAVASSGIELDSLSVVLKNLDIPIIHVTAPLKRIQALIAPECIRLNERCAAVSEFERTMEVAYIDESAAFAAQRNITWVNLSTDSDVFWTPRVIFEPIISGYTATEYGVNDSTMGIRTYLGVPIWKGNELTAIWNTPIYHTNDFRNGRFKNQKMRAGLRNLYFNQTFKINPNIYSTLSAGKFLFDTLGWVSDSVWNFDEGHQRVRLRWTELYNDDDRVYKKRQSYVGQYRYYFPSVDSAVQVSYGTYLDEDRGYLVETLHHFGDTTFSLYFKKSEYKGVGVAITIPLSPRKAMKPWFFQARMVERWSYGLETVVGQDTNPIEVSFVRVPTPTYTIEKDMFNHDRLSPVYIRSHVLRIQGAATLWEAE